MVKRKRYLAVTLLMLAMAAAVGAVAYGVWSRSAVPVDGTQWSQPAQMLETTEPETAATAEPTQTEETEAPTEWEPREVFFGDRSFLSDAEEIDLSSMEIESAQWVEERIRDMPQLQKVIMCDCGLGDEEMDALNRRYEDIRFVWTVRMGRISVRTDTNYFAPVVTGDYVTEIDLGPLKYCTDVVAVDLGHMAVRTCDWARNMPKLQYLILADTGITDISPLASCENLIFLELFLTAVRDYSPLLSCTRLEDPEPVLQLRKRRACEADDLAEAALVGRKSLRDQGPGGISAGYGVQFYLRLLHRRHLEAGPEIQRAAGYIGDDLLRGVKYG